VRLCGCLCFEASDAACCVRALAAHSSNMAALDVSPDGRALLAVGQDKNARQVVVLWDLADLFVGGEVRGRIARVCPNSAR